MGQWPLVEGYSTAGERAAPENASRILDLSDISLEELRSMDSPDLTDSLAYLMSDLDDPYSVRAGGGNPS
jgi:hypothetical protein